MDGVGSSGILDAFACGIFVLKSNIWFGSSRYWCTLSCWKHNNANTYCEDSLRLIPEYVCENVDLKVSRIRGDSWGATQSYLGQSIAGCAQILSKSLILFTCCRNANKLDILLSISSNAHEIQCESENECYRHFCMFIDIFAHQGFSKAVGTILGLGGGGGDLLQSHLYFKRIQFCTLVYLRFPISTELLTYFSHMAIHW